MTDMAEGRLASSHASSRHEVSILIGVGGYVGWQPGAKTSMIIMRPPQRWTGTGEHVRLLRRGGLLLKGEHSTALIHLDHSCLAQFGDVVFAMCRDAIGPALREEKEEARKRE